MYLFDPMQFKQFGSLYFEDEDKGFSYRYQGNKRFGGLWKSYYIPYGPICKTKESLLAFIDHINSQRFSKFRFDLPMIYDDKKKEEVRKIILDNGFKEKKYIQDGETILVYKHNYKPPSKTRQYIRGGKKALDIEVKEKLNDEELKQSYDIYLLLAKRIGFEPKCIASFAVINKKALSSIAKNKKTGEIEGFLMGYKVKDNILSLIYTGLTKKGLDEKAGYVLHGELFKQAFDKFGIEIIDFHGADRKKNRTYVSFKERWGNTEYKSFPGSFEKVKLF